MYAGSILPERRPEASGRRMRVPTLAAFAAERNSAAGFMRSWLKMSCSRQGEGEGEGGGEGEGEGEGA